MLRLAPVATRAQANALLDRKRMADFNSRFGAAPAQAADAHRGLGAEHHLAAILSIQQQRVVANDYYGALAEPDRQIGKPVHPGLRKGRVVIELRLDGRGRCASDAERDRGVQPQITRGGADSRVSGNGAMTADIPTLVKHRTFLLWSDTIRVDSWSDP